MVRYIKLFLLTWKTDTLHLVSVGTAQRGMKALEVRVSAGDNGWSLVTAAGLDHMDGVELERSRPTSQNLFV